MASSNLAGAAAVGALGVMLGLGLGYALFSDSPPGEAFMPAPASTSAPVPPPASRGRAALESREPPPLQPAAPPAPANAASEERKVDEARLAALQGELIALKDKLGSREAERLQLEGEPIAKPANLPSRFDPEQLRKSFEASLKEAGFQGAVTEVDCTEYPCILYGNGFGDRSDMDKLRGAAAFKDYADDSSSVHGWGVGKRDGGQRNYFGVALFPDDHDGGAPDDAFTKRLDHRMRQYWESAKPK